MTFLLYLDILSIKQVRTFFFTNTCIVGHISKLSPLPNFVKGDNSLKFLIPTVYPMLVGHISKLSPLPNFDKGDNSLKFLIPTVYPMLVGHVSNLSLLPSFVKGDNSKVSHSYCFKCLSHVSWTH
jgi:hypothetical protein